MKLLIVSRAAHPFVDVLKERGYLPKNAQEIGQSDGVWVGSAGGYLEVTAEVETTAYDGCMLEDITLPFRVVKVVTDG